MDLVDVLRRHLGLDDQLVGIGHDQHQHFAGLDHAADRVDGLLEDPAVPAPDYVARFQHLVQGRIRFGQPAHQIVFDAAALDLPLVQADPVAVRLAREQCERELDELGRGGQMVARVRRMLPLTDGFRSLEEVSAALAISPRTLKRKLANRGTTFSELLDRERCERALLMLGAAHYSIDDIAQRLGYSTPPNFVRAFRRWMGTTPAAYRRSRS